MWAFFLKKRNISNVVKLNVCKSHFCFKIQSCSAVEAGLEPLGQEILPQKFPE
jgi:hypothetical protein